MVKLGLILTCLFPLFPFGAEAGDGVELPGTPGFTAEAQRWGSRGELQVIALIVPQQSFPRGAGKLCISSGDGKMLCSDQYGPHGQRWDAPIAFYFLPDAVRNFPHSGSISIFSEGGKKLADFEADLRSVEKIARGGEGRRGGGE